MKKVLITAGPTREYLDPVRYITNESSGKMGYALAEVCEKMDWDVTMISGPVHIPSPLKKGKIIHVNSAVEMLDEVMKHSACDIAIFSAAVADYRPKEIARNKTKKQGDELQIAFVKNPDIAATFGKQKRTGQISIGFALETENLEAYGRQKLISKNLDAIVLNDASEPGAGFGVDTNRISILDQKGNKTDFAMKHKTEVALDIVNYVWEILKKSERVCQE